MKVTESQGGHFVNISFMVQANSWSYKIVLLLLYHIIISSEQVIGIYSYYNKFFTML